MRKSLPAFVIAFSLTAQEAAPPPPSPPPGLRTTAPHRGTNYDPPPAPRPKAEPVPAAPPPERPLFEWPAVEWGAPGTWVKLVLLGGAILLGLRAFLRPSD